MSSDNGARIIDGKALAASLRDEVREDIARLSAERGVTPGLAVVLVGDDPASQVYVRNKSRACEEVGIAAMEHRLGADTGEAELLGLIGRLNADPAVHGILVQFPVPAQIEAARVIDAIDPAKDVDGLHPVNAGRLAAGREAMVPCTPQGCMMMLKSQLAELEGLDALVIGRSALVGKPIAQLLLGENCTVTIAHSRTADFRAHALRSDILVAAVGRPRFVKGDWIKPGAIVIDVGINRVPAPDKGPDKTRLVGDVDFDSAKQTAGAITPVPGGVGPMTVACLMRNTAIAARNQAVGN